jgi:hypothetical protein
VTFAAEKVKARRQASCNDTSHLDDRADDVECQMTSSWDSDELVSFHALARSGLTSRLTFVITEGRWAEEHGNGNHSRYPHTSRQNTCTVPQSWYLQHLFCKLLD